MVYCRRGVGEGEGGGEGRGVVPSCGRASIVLVVVPALGELPDARAGVAVGRAYMLLLFVIRSYISGGVSGRKP